MKISEAFPSNYLKAADLQGRTIRATINLVQSEDIGGDHKPIIYFAGKEKGLVLNKTNASTLVMAFGDDTDGWQGAEIELFPMAVPFNGQMVPAIRVKVPEQRRGPPAQFAPNAAQRAQPNSTYTPQSGYVPPGSPVDPNDEVPF